MSRPPGPRADGRCVTSRASRPDLHRGLRPGSQPSRHPGWQASTEVLPRGFFDRPAVQVAPGLLGCVLAHETAEGLVAVVLAEVEAYAGEADPASHAFRGRTARTA